MAGLTFDTDDNLILSLPQKTFRHNIFPGRILIIRMTDADAVDIDRIAVHNRSEPQFRLFPRKVFIDGKFFPEPYASDKAF